MPSRVPSCQFPVLPSRVVVNRSSHCLPLAVLLAALLPPGCNPAAGDQAVSVDSTLVDEATFEAARNAAFQLDEARSMPGEARADIGEVRDALLAAHAMRPQAFGVNRRLGHVFADLRMHVPAVEHFRLALDAHPDDNAVRQSLVAVLAMIEAEEQMLVELPILRTEADSLPPDEAYRALSLRGRFLFQDRDYTGAQALFALAQQGRPDYKEAVKGLADCARRLGRAEEGDHWSSILARLLALTDDQYGNKRDDRKQKLTELLDLLPEYSAGYKLLADLHRRNGDVGAACAVIEKFIELHDTMLEPADVEGLRERYCKKKRAGP